MDRLTKKFLTRLLLVAGVLVCPAMECKADFMEEVKNLLTFTKGKVWIKKVNFSISKDMNSPVTVTLVIIYDAELLKTLKEMPAQAFFQEDALKQMKTNAAAVPEEEEPSTITKPTKKEIGKDADFFTWEAAPGYPIEPQEIEMSKSTGALGGFIFANYGTDGDHRIPLGDESEITIVLGSDITIKKVS